MPRAPSAFRGTPRSPESAHMVASSPSIPSDTNLVPSDTNGFPDAFVRDRTEGTTMPGQHG